MIARLHLLALAPFIALVAHAQPYYTFSLGTGSYVEIIGTPLPLSSGWGQINALNGEDFPITGETVQVGGARQIWIYEDGFLNFDYASVNTVFISALFSTTVQLDPVDATSSLTYVVSGPAGNKILTVQWKNYRRADGVAGDHVNFQIQLHQATGIIELRYGPSENQAATYTAADGPNAGYYFADYNASVIYDRIWLAGAPSAPTLSTAQNPAFTGLTDLPTQGTVFRFSPTWQVGIAEQTDASASFTAQYDPSSGSVLVNFSDNATGGSLVLYDAQGRTIANVARNANTVAIPVAALHGAIYLLRYSNERGERQAMRVVGL